MGKIRNRLQNRRHFADAFFHQIDAGQLQIFKAAFIPHPQQFLVVPVDSGDLVVHIAVGVDVGREAQRLGGSGQCAKIHLLFAGSGNVQNDLQLVVGIAQFFSGHLGSLVQLGNISVFAQSFFQIPDKIVHSRSFGCRRRALEGVFAAFRAKGKQQNAVKHCVEFSGFEIFMDQIGHAVFRRPVAGAIFIIAVIEQH